MKEIKLFDYQEDMKERIEKALRLHRSVMAQMPTGTGKTVLLASVVESFLREHSIAMFGLLPIEGSWFLRFEKLFKEFFLKPHPFFIRIFRTTLSILRKSPRPSLPLKRAPPLPRPSHPQGRGEETALLGAPEPLRSKDGGPSKVSPDCAGWDRLTATCLRPAEGLGDRLGKRGGDGLGATSASSDNPTSDMMPIKAVSIQWLSKHYDEIEEEPGDDCD